MYFLRRGKVIELTKRQEKILEMVKANGPITGEQIAEKLHLTRAAIRADLAVLTMSGTLDARPRVGYYYVGKPLASLFAVPLNKIKVADIQSVPIILKDNASVYEAITTMFLEDVGTLFVVNQKGIFVGLVSRKDFLKVALGGNDIHRMPVGVVMTRMPNIITTTPDESVYIAAKKIIEHQIDCLPVVKRATNSPDEWEVLGRMTKTNLTRLLVELVEEK